MNFWRMATKIFAFFSLLFASLISTNAQSNSSIYELQAGTKMLVQMDSEINSKVFRVDDTFTTKVVAAVVVRETVVVPVGTIIEGRITKVQAASAGKSGSLTVAFEMLRLANGDKRAIEGVLVKLLKAESSQGASVLAIIGGTALGGIFGAVSKTDNGALIGAGIGAGVGTGIALLKKGKDVSIKTEERFEIKLTKNVTLPVPDF